MNTSTHIIRTLSATVFVVALTACGKTESNPTPAPVAALNLPFASPLGNKTPVPLPEPVAKTSEFKPLNLTVADYVGVTKSEDIIAIAAAATDHQFTDEELASLFNVRVNYIDNGFDKQAAIKATADKGRELLKQWKGTKGLSLDVDTPYLQFEHFDFAASTFGTKSLVDGLTGARYAHSSNTSPTMPTLDLSGTPSVMYVYKPANTEEAKMLEGRVSDYMAGGYQVRYHIQIVSSSYENSRIMLKLAVVAVDVKTKTSKEAVVSLRAL